MGTQFTNTDLEKAGFVPDGNGGWKKRDAQKPEPPKKTPGRGRVRNANRKRGQMNKTEATYSDHLQALQQSGKIIWWAYEAITLKLAHDTRWTPDFIIQYPDGEVVLHEVKGSKFVFQEASKVRVKVTQTLFPFRVFVVLPRTQKMGGGWDITEINPNDK